MEQDAFFTEDFRQEADWEEAGLSGDEEPIVTEEPVDAEKTASIKNTDPSGYEEEEIPEPADAAELEATDLFAEGETDFVEIPVPSDEKDGEPVEDDLLAGASETVTVGDYSYLIVDGNASISKYNGTDTSVVVPTSFSYGGTNYRIRKIENFAFEGCTSIETLVIPDGISSLGYGAFKNCTSLNSITINGNIGDHSGYNTNGGSVYLDGSYRNPVYAYTAPFYNAGANADSLTVTFSGNATYVPAYLFATNASESNGTYAHVKKVVLSGRVESINSYAFYRCYDLEELVMGDRLTVFNSWSFAQGSRCQQWTEGYLEKSTRCEEILCILQTFRRELGRNRRNRWHQPDRKDI